MAVPLCVRIGIRFYYYSLASAGLHSVCVCVCMLVNTGSNETQTGISASLCEMQYTENEKCSECGNCCSWSPAVRFTTVLFPIQKCTSISLVGTTMFRYFGSPRTQINKTTERCRKKQKIQYIILFAIIYFITFLTRNNYTCYTSHQTDTHTSQTCCCASAEHLFHVLVSRRTIKAIIECASM